MKTTTHRNNITYIKDNIFDHVYHFINAENNGSSVIIPHVCNNINLFGAGFAASVAKNYPIVKENYHLLGNKFLKNNLGHTQFIEVYKDKSYGHKLIFANMIAQNGIIGYGNPRPLNYLALLKSMINISQFIKNNYTDDNKIQIHAPKFGCGLAGGNWSFIEDLIEDTWKEFSVYIYELKK